MIPIPSRTPTPEAPLSAPAYLLLEDGRRFDGVRLGAGATALGEVVFNTSMTGYQEILTDPSYTGQLVTMTSPLQGNYGVNEIDGESRGPQAAGFVVREAARRPSNWRSRQSLHDYLVAHEVTGIADVDTRALTLHLRTRGAMRGAIAPADRDEAEVLAEIRAHPQMEGRDLVSDVSTSTRYEVPAVGEERFHVVAYDFGIKAHSPRLLAERGCRVTVVPAATTVDEILAMDPDGLFLSNGPGDPAAIPHARDAILTLSEADVPVFGICLGHQLIARAFGGRTYKLPFGHHGANHPVAHLERGSVEITSQNHGFAVEGADDGTVPGAPELRITHRNLHDGTVEGIEHVNRPVLAVQYHPEAAPGPHDSRYLFDRFVRLLEARSG